MRLARLIEEFIAEKEWDDEIEKDVENGMCQLSTSLSINNQSFRLYIEGDENRNFLFLYLYAPFSIIEGKYVDACMLFNFINNIYVYPGRLTAGDDGSIRYIDIIDVENFEPSIEIIQNMLGNGVSLFNNNTEEIAAVALTQKTYEAIRGELEKNTALKEARNKDKE
ncbi:MAG: hypothetical protein WCG19_09025 [Chlorobiaceae bacterium]